MNERRLKRLYPKLYKFRSCDQDWYFRPLNIGEYRQVSVQDEPDLKESTILSFGLVWPILSFADIPSGTAEHLVMFITQVTDINEGSVLQKVQEKRDSLGMTDDILRWKIQIVKHLNYTPDQVDAMSLDKFVESLILVEEMIGMPLVAQGEETPSAPPKDTTAQPDTLENEVPAGTNMGSELNTMADATVDTLRSVYLDAKHRRKVVGRK